MTQSELDALRREIRDGFRSVNDSIHDLSQAVHGVMVKLLHPLEIEEIRSRMKNPPAVNGGSGKKKVAV